MGTPPGSAALDLGMDFDEPGGGWDDGHDILGDKATAPFLGEAPKPLEPMLNRDTPCAPGKVIRHLNLT